MSRYSKTIIYLYICILQLLTYVTPRKTCNETFCGKLRKSPEGYPRYNLDLSTLEVFGKVVLANLTSPDGSPTLFFQFKYISHSKIDVTIVDFILDVPIKSSRPSNRAVPIPLSSEVTNETVIVTSGSAKSIIYNNPFKIESYFNNKLISIINEKHRLVLQGNSSQGVAALDVTFQNVQQAYGIPLHADNLALRTTTDGFMDPYRLYHHNSGQYKLKSTEALHSSVPLLYVHGKNQSTGILLDSLSQMWVDITHRYNKIETYFMNEMPYIRVFIFTGPTITDAVVEGGRGGVPLYLPQYFTLGYHQSRHSYANENQVLNVIDKFNSDYLPLESVWLDINHTDSGKYFTWDPVRFPDPIKLQNQLAVENRSLVVTTGPHMKVEKGYFVHDEASARGFYVRNPNGSDYIGKCLPGDSSYLDFYNPELQNYYASLFLLETFKAKNLYVFLDWNEPTVLEAEQHENTLPSDLLHTNGQSFVSHGYIHNVYSSLHAMTAFLGYFSLERFPERPFIATHSHSFPDTNYGPVITGDNYASWEHLRISFPMCLSEALVNTNMCGANIGGFAGTPDEELYQRWYQAGAWLPFYRAHFAADVPPREPYLYPENVKARVRKAMYQRYAHLPVWYTLLWENIKTFQPIIRPLFYHYPQEEATFTIDQQLLLGDGILVAPVLESGVATVSVYLPGGDSELWYSIDDNYKVLRGTGYQLLHVNLDSVPVFYRAGRIIARKNIPRLTSAATVNDPYTLYICLNTTNEANGTLYVDDYKTLYYEVLNKFLYIGFSFIGNSLHTYKLREDADYDGAAPIGEIVILNPPQNVQNVQLNVENKVIDCFAKVAYSNEGKVLTLSNLSLVLQQPFKLTLI
ncbi:hypothetical protein ILUMI_21710 [Ignelater luminosus]|uniref:Glucosidase II subunit alpha n=1 Tax=Ignelater luminosus TaxID=2038154 RepID=A0A8K0CFR5_IGNLU|nr:hypothetical protein ILUMI_21710 [Ignelater luminosus]